MIAGAATLGAMPKSPNARRVGGPKSWEELSRPDADQNQRFLAESLSLLLADLLRSVLSDASPALPADEFAVERYRNLADSLADGESRRRTSLGITRAGLAKRCVTWLKLLLTPAPNATAAAGCGNSSMRWGCFRRCSTANRRQGRGVRG